MKSIIARLASCALGAAAGSLLFGIPLGFASGLALCAWLLLLSVLIRPLFLLVILPLNMFLFGLAGLAADALLVWWASAWTPGLALTFAQAVLFAALIGLAALPYELCRRDGLLKRYRNL